MGFSLPLDDAPAAGKSVLGIRDEVATDVLSNAKCADDACPVFGYPGRDLGAAFFDGVNDRLTVALARTAPFQSFMNAFWAKRQPYGVPMPVVAQAFGFTSVYSYSAGFDDQGRFACTVDSSGTPLRTSIPVDGAWHHWVCGYDGLAGMAVILKDGVVQAARASSFGLNLSGTITIGMDTNGNALNGVLDRVQWLWLAPTVTNTRALIDEAPGLLFHFDDQIDGDAATTPQRYLDEPLDSAVTCAAAATCPVKGARGKIGPAISLDGISQTLTLTDPALFAHPDREFAASAWINTNAIDAPLALFGQAGLFEVRIEPFSSTSATLKAAVWSAPSSGGAAPSLEIMCGKINKGVWTHVALTWQADGSFILYVNGGEVARAAVGSATVSDALNLLRICDAANSWGGAPYRFDGRIDELALYRRALLPATIKSQYDAQIAYSEDRQQVAITVDRDAPSSALLSVAG